MKFYNKLSKKNKMIVSVIGILLIISLFIGASYAYYLFSVGQEGSNILGSDCFKLSFSGKNNITLLDTIPLTEDEANGLTPYEFTIKNICNRAAEYDVNIETLNTSTLSENYLRFKLDDNPSLILGTIATNDSSFIVNSNATASRTIATGMLLKNEEATYRVKMWIDENSTVEQSAEKYFESKIVVNAALNKNPYRTIALNVGEGSISENTKTAVYKQRLGDIEEPQYPGHVFTGWYTTQTYDDGTGVNNQTIVDGSFDTIYAKYAIGSYELSLDLDGGEFSGPTSTQVEYGQTYTIVGTPTKLGHTFAGWEVVSGNGTTLESNTVTMGVENSVVKAKYTVNNYNLTLIKNNGEQNETRSVAYGSDVELTNPSKTGYTFSGWTNIDKLVGGKMPAEDVELSANYIVNTYKWIVYHEQGNIGNSAYSVVAADTSRGQAAYGTTFPNTDIRKNYAGFTRPSDPYPTGTIVVDKEPNDSEDPTKNVLHYHYERNQYQLTVDLNGGESGTESQQLYYEEQLNLSASRTGYDLNGWTVTSGGQDEGTSKGTSISGSTLTMGAKASTVKANWTAKTFTVTFNENGGDDLDPDSKSVTYNSTYGELPTPVRDGYNFEGWWTEESGGSQITSSTQVTITENQTLYAHWSPITASQITYSNSTYTTCADVNCALNELYTKFS